MSNSMFHTEKFVNGKMTICLTERALIWLFTEQGHQSSKKNMFKTVIMYSVDIIKGKK